MVNLVFAGMGNVFPSVVRQFNMLRPVRWRYHLIEPSGHPAVMSWDNAEYLKDWLPYNLRLNTGITLDTTDIDTTMFGAFTTAPDGTTDTARLVVEKNTNSKHSVLAGTSYLGSNRYYLGKMRLAGVFKYAGRRIVLSLTTAPVTTAGGPTEYGAKAIFDLRNGQVAVDTAVYGAVLTVPWTIYPATMTAVGNGWYLCSVEAQVNFEPLSQGGALFGIVSLDQGTGSMAEKSTYIGDNLSGVYGWRTSMLPSRAWDLNETVFFDDFDDDTMANIDVTNSRAEGFDWYLHNNMVGYDNPSGFINHPTTVPGELSVASSVLTVGHQYALCMSTFACSWTPPNWPTSFVPWTYPDDVASRGYNSDYVGRAFTLPALFECRTRWDMELLGSGGNMQATMWTNGLEYLTGGNYADPSSAIASIENDFFEVKGSALPDSHIIHIPAGPGQPGGTAEVGLASTTDDMEIWIPLVAYGGGRHVERLGNRYTSLTSHINKPPESNPTDWGPYTFTGPGLPPLTADVSEFHTYSTLWFPYTEEQPGQIFTFWDGQCVGVPQVYGPDIPAPENIIWESDWQQFPVLFGGQLTMPLYIDWVKVTK